MSREHIDDENLTVTGAHEGRQSRVSIIPEPGGVVIVVGEAYGPKGNSLVGISDVKFDGYPAVTVGVRYEGTEGLVHLSPIHGDKRKEATIEIPHGARCEVFCPVSKQPLEFAGEVEDESGARYFAIYLTPKLEQGAMVALSDTWGHYHSRIIDGMELISYWAAKESA